MVNPNKSAPLNEFALDAIRQLAELPESDQVRANDDTVAQLLAEILAGIHPITLNNTLDFLNHEALQYLANRTLYWAGQEAILDGLRSGEIDPDFMEDEFERTFEDRIEAIDPTIDRFNPWAKFMENLSRNISEHDRAELARILTGGRP